MTTQSSAMETNEERESEGLWMEEALDLAVV